MNFNIPPSLRAQEQYLTNEVVGLIFFYLDNCSIRHPNEEV